MEPAFPKPDLFRRLPPPYFSELVAGVRSAAAVADVVDLARGNPEVEPPAHVLAAMRAAIDASGVHGYPPFAGTRSLIDAFVEHHHSVYGVVLDPDREVVVVPGTKTAIALCCAALAQRRDAVLMPDPGYPDYPSGIAVAGADMVPLRLDEHAGWAPDYASVSAADRRRSRMMFLNYPSNPCGAVATRELFDDAVSFAQAHSIAVVHDLAYGELVFGDARPVSFLATAGARDVGVELVSMSKTYAMAGWRLGFVAGNAEIVSRVRELLDHLTVGVFLAVQHAGAVALQGPQDFVGELRETYSRRARTVADALGVAPAVGSYFTWWKLPPPITADTLLHDAGVAVAPGEGFGPSGTGWARLSVAVPDDRLREGLQRIRRHAADHGIRL